MKMKISGILGKTCPPSFTLMTIALMYGLHKFFPILELFDISWRLSGLLPLLAGSFTCISAKRQLAVRKNTLNTFSRPQKLVIDGWYRQTRNPIYLGLALIACGVWLFCGTLSPAVAFVVFILVTDRFYIPYEEEIMQQVFGQEYADYKNRVRRWF